MNAFDWTKDAIAYLKKYAELGQICFADVGRFEDCNRIWAGVGIVLGVACALALLYFVRHFYREYSAHRRAWRKRQAELEIAPSEVMNEYKWSGEKALDANLSHDEIIQRIKEAKARQRGDAAPESDNKPGGDPALGAGIRHR